jgi:hypothetical protein
MNKLFLGTLLGVVIVNATTEVPSSFPELKSCNEIVATLLEGKNSLEEQKEDLKTYLENLTQQIHEVQRQAEQTTLEEADNFFIKTFPIFKEGLCIHIKLQEIERLIQEQKIANQKLS